MFPRISKSRIDWTQSYRADYLIRKIVQGHPTNLVDGVSNLNFYSSDLVPVYGHIQLTSIILEFVGWPVLLVHCSTRYYRNRIISFFWSSQPVWLSSAFFRVEKPTKRIPQENADEPLENAKTTAALSTLCLQVTVMTRQWLDSNGDDDGNGKNNQKM